MWKILKIRTRTTDKEAEIKSEGTSAHLKSRFYECICISAASNSFYLSKLKLVKH